ncbi:hypothetical protein [Arthrobacter sp. A2-55]|uniref:hypothetical protein n=1 Tax=Arthrobacter sp. A2-55 TaxID=2897337 RepID=UPI0021CD9315|nr:hypothetical protein [Arthrobacter sp. A2-55]MCU6479097.1 hypothetical protein [Arthrobacter sp. A2-55]
MVWLKTKDTYSDTAVAASVAIALLKRTKQNTWTDLVRATDEADLAVAKVFKTVELTDRQLELLNAQQPILGLLQISPAVVPAICPQCTHFVLVSDVAPTRCMVTPDCPGKPYKVLAAVGAKENPTPEAPLEDMPGPAPAETPLTASEFDDDAFA